jgi:hypothetical protein
MQYMKEKQEEKILNFATSTIYWTPNREQWMSQQTTNMWYSY